MRIDADGHLIYANPASAPILRTIGASVGKHVPPEILAQLTAVAPKRGFVEVVADRRTFAVWPVAIADLNFTNLYGVENERLLLNILPAPIADRLRNGEALIADRFDDVTLMFADIVEFTRLSASMSRHAG